MLYNKTFVMLSLDELQKLVESGSLFLDHVASVNGYIRKNVPISVIPYDGRFAEGYKVVYPNVYGLKNGKHSTNFHRVEYYIENTSLY